MIAEALPAVDGCRAARARQVALLPEGAPWGQGVRLRGGDPCLLVAPELSPPGPTFDQHGPFTLMGRKLSTN